MSDVDDSAPMYALAFDEAGRALDGQERTVNELRSRAGVLIAAAAITTSFFGARAVNQDLSTMVWLATGAFACIGISVLFVLWPRSNWEFSASATDLIATYIETEVRASLPRIHRDLALHRSASYDRNATQLRVLFGAFRVGLILLVVEVGAWMVALSERV
jgi:hypothetical protein